MRIAEIFLQYNCWFKYNKKSKNIELMIIFNEIKQYKTDVYLIIS